jgi:hypothetical protein
MRAPLLYAPIVCLIVFLTGCGGGGESKATILPVASPSPSASPLATPTPGSSLSETFSGTSTTPDGWVAGGTACLTAGSASTPTSSVPACSGATDVSGSGTLQLTDNGPSQIGFVISKTAIIAPATSLTISFDYFAYSGTHADGLSVFILDANQPPPTSAGSPGGSLGYAGYAGTTPGIANGYLGVGLDSFGNFTVANPPGATGGAGFLGDTIAVRGAASTGYVYLGGIGATLPFSLDDSSSKTRPTALHVQVVINTASDTVSVAVGGVTYIAALSFNVTGQPAFPARVYLGFAASTGLATDFHQVRNVVVSST